MGTDGLLLEKFCNTSHPEPLTSAANELTLHFHSDEADNDNGFQIHYSTIEGMPGCGGTFTATSGEFGSPMQDGSYPKNIECHYVIKLPKDSKMKLTFLSFKLEDSHSCNFDYVEVREAFFKIKFKVQAIHFRLKTSDLRGNQRRGSKGR